MAGEVLGQKLRLRFGEGGQWGVSPGVGLGGTLKVASLNQQRFETDDFADANTASFNYSGKPGFGFYLQPVVLIGKRWGESPEVDAGSVEVIVLRHELDEADAAFRKVKASVDRLDGEVKKLEGAIAALEKEIPELEKDSAKNAAAITKKKAELEARRAELPKKQQELAKAQGELAPRQVARDQKRGAVHAKQDALRALRALAEAKGQVAQTGLILGYRYAFEQHGWALADSPADFTGGDVTERDQTHSFVFGVQYRDLALVAGLVLGGNAEFERNATPDQKSGVLVSGAPIPSDQPYPIVLKLDESVGLRGWDVSLQWAVTRVLERVPLVLSFTVGQRDPENVGVDYPGTTLSEERMDFREGRGVPVGDESVNATLRLPTNTFARIGVGVDF